MRRTCCAPASATKRAAISLLAALRHNFGEISVTGEAAGLHLVWYLPPGVPDAAVVESSARRVRIGVYSLTSGGGARGAGPRR